MEFAGESLIFSKDHLEYNIDEWLDGTKNILLITGMSGSGKSTLAKEYQEKYNAVKIELDLFEFNRFIYTMDGDKPRPKTALDEGAKIIRKYFDDIYGGQVDFQEMSTDKFYDEFMKFFQYLFNYAQSHLNKKFIFEGLQIITAVINRLDLETLSTFPCIVTGTSVATSIMRRIKRDSDFGPRLLKHPIQILQWYCFKNKNSEWYRKNLKKMNE